MSPAFTPEAVRDVLAAAGHPEHVKGETEGFVVVDARENLREILIEVCRVRPADGWPPWDEAAKAHERAILDLYQATLANAGYYAGFDRRVSYSTLIVKEAAR